MDLLEFITVDRARQIASEWHGGQTSALYSFSSSGNIDDFPGWDRESETNPLVWEISREISNAADNCMEITSTNEYYRDLQELTQLLGYVLNALDMIDE